jgi:hypothetical protein
MTTEQMTHEKQQPKSITIRQSGDAVYGIGMFGAWAYYIGRASTPQERLVGFLKGFIWPAILVYKLLKFLNPESE